MLQNSKYIEDKINNKLKFRYNAMISTNILDCILVLPFFIVETKKGDTEIHSIGIYIIVLFKVENKKY